MGAHGVFAPDVWLVSGCGAAGGLMVVRSRPNAGVLAALGLWGAVGAFGMATRAQGGGWDWVVPFDARIEGTVVQRGRTAAGSWLELDAVRAASPAVRPIPGRLRIDLDSFEEPEVRLGALPGERWRLAVRLRPFAGLRNPGTNEWLRRVRRLGIGAQGRLAHPRLAVRISERERWLPLRPIEALRERALRAVSNQGEGVGLMTALVLGERSGLAQATRDGFAQLGVAHLLSVSGLHIAWVAGVSFFLIQRFLLDVCGIAGRVDPRPWAAAGALAASGAYALAAGFGVPVRRALILVAALLLGSLWKRRAQPASALSLAALLILSQDPRALFMPGAQLSFAACCGLVFVARMHGQNRFRAPMRRAASMLDGSAVAYLVTAPFAALSLGNTAPFALLFNFLLVPWTAAVLLPTALCGFAARALMGGGPADGVWDAALFLHSATLNFVAEATSRIPHFHVAPAPSLLGLSLVCLGVGAVLLQRRAWIRWIAAPAVAIGFTVLPISESLPKPPRVVFLDVGHGDATLIEAEDRAVLVDGGFAREGGIDLGARAVVPALRALGVERLDLVVATHADRDHWGGLIAVLEAMPVGEVWIPYGGGEDPGFDSFRASVRERSLAIVERGQGQAPWRRRGLSVESLWPPPLPGSGALSRNDRSLVLRISIGSRRILLPGDLEGPGERGMLRAGGVTADVLKLSHHGSQTSSSDAFLRAVGAGVLVVTAPCYGRFPMPHPAVVKRVRMRGGTLWWTGRDGAVSVGLENELTVLPWGNRARRCLAK